MTETVGARFARAVASRDAEGLAGVLADEVDFKGLTPGRFWEGTSVAEVLDAVLGHWFGESDHVEELLDLEEGEPVVDTARVGYRVRVVTGGTPYAVEQQVYYRTDNGRISYLRVVCSGYRTLADD